MVASPPAFPPHPHPHSRGPRPNLSVILPSLPRTPPASENPPPPPEGRPAGGLGVTTAAALSGPQTRPWKISIRRCQSYQLLPSSQSSLLQLWASCRFGFCMNSHLYNIFLVPRISFIFSTSTTLWTTMALSVLEVEVEGVPGFQGVRARTTMAQCLISTSTTGSTPRLGVGKTLTDCLAPERTQGQGVPASTSLSSSVRRPQENTPRPRCTA